ncbi:CARDB domain-containing protein, partial [Bacteroidota bacterium]
YPAGLAVDTSGNIFIADEDNHIIRKIDKSTGNISTICGNYVEFSIGGYSGDDGPAIDAEVSYPEDLIMDAGGNLYLVDAYYPRIRKISVINEISGTPEFADIGIHDVTLEVSDGWAQTQQDFDINVTTNDMPDLTVLYPSANREHVLTGDTLTISCVIKNLGDSIAISNMLTYYFSDDNVLDGSDTELLTLNPNSLGTGDSVLINALVTIPSSPIGNYYILFNIDDTKIVNERDENNNLANTQIAIDIPDLVVSGCQIDPTTVNVGDSVSISCYVKNQGNTRVITSTSLNYYLSTSTTEEEITIGSSDIGHIIANDSVLINTKIKIPSSTALNAWYILFKADGDSILTETDENNNISYLSITLIHPDLLIKNMTIAPASIEAGYTIDVNGLVKNIGDCEAIASTLKIYLSSDITVETDDIVIGEHNIIELAVNDSVAFSTICKIPYETIADNWYILVKTDGINIIGENNEDNNVEYDSLTVTASPNPGDVWEWAKAAEGDDTDMGKSVATDLTGNVYITGYFEDSSLTVGATTLTNNGGDDIFIIKYSDSGNVLWAKSVGTTSDESGMGIATDASGNVYVTGNYNTPIVFGATVLYSSGGGDIFLTKYNPNGDVLWATKIGGAYLEYVNDITVDVSNNVYITGCFTSPDISVDDIILYNNGGNNEENDILIAKYDNSGNILWAKSVGGTADDQANAISTDLNGNFYITGDYKSTSVFFGDTTLTNGSSTYSKAYIAKYNTDGNAIWAISSYLSQNAFGKDVTIDESGNIYATGYYNGSSLNFESWEYTPNTLYNSSATPYIDDIYIVKFDNKGNVLWTRSGEGNKYDYAYGITTDATGNVYNTGYAYSSISFGDIDLIGGGIIYVVKYDSNGNIMWAKSAGGNGDDYAYDIISDPNDDVYITGAFRSNSITFGTTTIFNNETIYNGNFDAFLAKISDADLGDFSIFDQTINTDTIVLGTSPNLHATIKYNGTYPTQPTRIKFNLSTDSINSDGELLVFDKISGLSDNQTIDIDTSILIPLNTEPGDYYITFQADAENEVREKNEWNNMVNIPVTVVAPDLFVQNPNVSPALLNPGDNIRLSSAIINAGNYKVDSCKLRYYLSDDEILDSEDTLLGYYDIIKYLLSDTFILAKSTLTVPSDILTGEWYILFIVDEDSIVTESNENNNLTYTQITVTEVILTKKTIDWEFVQALDHDNNSSYPNDVTTDLLGNVYITGVFNDSMFFDNDTLISNGSNDIFIAKFDNLGNEIWARSAGGSDNDISNGIATDASGNVCITGCFYSSSILYGDVTLINNGNSDVFIAKYDQNGNILWVKSAGSYSTDIAYGITIDLSDNIYITGEFHSDPLYFGSTSLSRDYSSVNMFVVKYDTNGNVLWAKNAGQYGKSIATDTNGNVFIIGDINSYLIFGGIKYITQGIGDIALYKYDSTGNELWAKLIGGNGNDRVKDISVDTLGNVYITGSFDSPTWSFGPTTLTSNGITTCYIAKCDNDGNELWARSAGGNVLDYGISVSIDEHGNVYSLGRYNNSSITFGDTTIFNSGGVILIVVKYNKNGNVMQAYSVDGVEGYSCASSPVNNLYVSGYKYLGSTTFGSINIDNYGGFLAKLSELPDLLIKDEVISPLIFMPGDSLDFTCTIENIGSKNANASDLNIYISSDTIFDTEDILMDSIEINNISGYSSVLVDAKISTLNNISFGEQYLLLIADANDEIGELNNDNNQVTIPVQVILPDLIIKNESVDNISPKPGDTVYISAVILNQDLGFADSSELGIYLSFDNYTLERNTDIILDSMMISDLSFNDSIILNNHSVKIPLSASVGNCGILIVVDKDSMIAESDESNNIELIQITTVLPDLIVEEIELENTEINAGTSSDISIVVENQDFGPADSSELKIYLSTDDSLEIDIDILLDSIEVGYINPHNSSRINLSITIPLNITPGNYYIIAETDADKIILENNENNNISDTSVIIIEALSDLEIISISLPYEEFYPDDTASVSIEISNLGLGTSPVSDIEFYLSSDTLLSNDDIHLKTLSVESLPGNSSTTQVISGDDVIISDWDNIIPTWSPQGGTYTSIDNPYKTGINTSDLCGEYTTSTSQYDVLRLYLDTPPDFVAFPEYRLKIYAPPIGGFINFKFANTDNSIFAEKNISPIPNQWDELVFNFEGRDGSDFVKFDIFIDFTGTTPDDKWYIDDVIKSKPLSKIIQIPDDISIGDWYLIAIADPDDLIEEENENNNLFYYDLSVIEIPLPDLTITEKSIMPVKASTGDNVAVTANIQNNGGPATSCYLKYFLSEDDTYNEDDIQLGENYISNIGLFASRSFSKTLTIPTDISGGFWSLIFYVDADDDIAESDETNNTSIGLIEVESNVGIENLVANKYFSIYPNPTKGKFTLEINNGFAGILDTEYELNVFNLVGEVVLTEHIEFISGKSTINMLDQPEGIYIIKIETTHGNAYERLMIE